MTAAKTKSGLCLSCTVHNHKIVAGEAIPQVTGSDGSVILSCHRCDKDILEAEFNAISHEISVDPMEFFAKRAERMQNTEQRSRSRRFFAWVRSTSSHG